MLRAVTEVLQSRGTTGWLVGGSVRDRELGRDSPDLDVAVADDAATVAKEVARALASPWFALSERHPTYRVLGPGGYADVAAVRGGDIAADLALRDFTMNAMALPLDEGDLIDPYGGLAHLREGLLVAVSRSIFMDDPLRLMRAPRFCHVLDLRLDEALSVLVREQAVTLHRAAAERVTTEMTLTLNVGRAAEAVRLWRDLGLLAVMLPEVAPAGRLESTLALLERLDVFLDRPAAWFSEAADLLRSRLAGDVDGATTRPVALRLAGLMYALRAGEVEEAGGRLRLSGAVVSLLRAAARSLPAGPAGEDAPGSKRSEVLFLWGAAPWEPEVITLQAAADPARLGRARRLMSLWAERTEAGVPQPPVDGLSIMRELGLEAGPLVGKALREVRLTWEAGEATSVDDALAAARSGLSGS